MLQDCFIAHREHVFCMLAVLALVQQDAHWHLDKTVFIRYFFIITGSIKVIRAIPTCFTVVNIASTI